MAYQFNGTNQHLSTASSPVSGVPMTIAGWIRRTSAVNNGANTVLASVGVLNGTDRNQVQFPGDNNGIAQAIAVRGATLHTAQQPGGTAFTQNSWNHLCGIFAAQDSRSIYLDGILQATNALSLGGTQATANSILIGARSNGVSLGNYMNGDIADVGVWSVVLTDDEIASLAKGVACRLVRPQSLVFYAPLARDLVDLRGGLAITNNNTATVAVHPRVYA